MAIIYHLGFIVLYHNQVAILSTSSRFLEKYVKSVFELVGMEIGASRFLIPDVTVLHHSVSQKLEVVVETLVIFSHYLYF